MKSIVSRSMVTMLIISFVMPTVVDARIKGRQRTAVSSGSRLVGDAISDQSHKVESTVKQQSVKDTKHPGQLSPFTGNIFKTSNFTFVEGKAYSFSNFVKDDEKLLVDATMYTCGITVRGPNVYFEGKMQPFFDNSAAILFRDHVFDIEAKNLKNTYITFREGSADVCTSIPEAKAFVFTNTQQQSDKLTFTIKKKDKDEIDGKIVKVSKSIFDKVKTDCSKIDMKSLLTVKNLMLSSAVVSGIGTAAGIAGTTMGALSIVNNKKDGKEDLNKKLDIGQTVTSAIGTATSATSLTTSAISADKIKKLIQDIEDCKNSTSRLGVVID